MWSRADLKSRAKINLNRCYWKAVLTALILSIVTGGRSFNVKVNVGTSGGHGNLSDEWNYFYYRYISVIGVFVVLCLALMLMLVAVVVKTLLFNPLEIGCKRFFIFSRVQETELNEIGVAFSGGYWNVVKVQFLRYLYIFLWSLLFVIPGIIKWYEYRMIPYLLTVCTCSIVGIFYVMPYMAFTDAELYITLQYHRYNRMNMQNGGPYGQWQGC